MRGGVGRALTGTPSEPTYRAALAGWAAVGATDRTRGSRPAPSGASGIRRPSERRLRDEDRSVSDLVYRVVVAAAKAVFRGLGLRIEVRGADRLPARGPAILASNHVSFLDFTFVGLVGDRRGRNVRFLTKEGVFASRPVGAAMRAMGHISVDRSHGEVALRHALEALRAGEVVGVFPEATISRSWTLRAFRPGAAAMAVWTQAPLVPVVVWGGQRILTVGGRFSLRRGTPVTILVGQPIRPGPDADPAEVTRVLRARIGDLLEEAMDTYPDRPQARTDAWWVPARRGGTAPTPEVAAVLDDAAMWGTARAAPRGS